MARARVSQPVVNCPVSLRRPSGTGGEFAVTIAPLIVRGGAGPAVSPIATFQLWLYS